MKYVFPVIFHKSEDIVPYFVEIPDLDVMTQGTSLVNAMDMAREAICIAIIELQKKGNTVPVPTPPNEISTDDSNAVISLIDADIEAYKRSLENRSVRKNCTIPMWLNDEAEKAGINFSNVLQQGLKNALGINT